MGDARTGVSFLMLAAGAGERLGLGPKGSLELQGRPLLCWLADKEVQVAKDVLVAVPNIARDPRVAAFCLSLAACCIAFVATQQKCLTITVRRLEWLIRCSAANGFRRQQPGRCFGFAISRRVSCTT